MILTSLTVLSNICIAKIMNKKVGLKVLKDDRSYFPDYNDALLVRNDLFERYADTAPNLEEVLNMAVAPFYEQAQQRGILPASVIPVAHCHADLLLLTAGNDSVWPSPYAGQQMVQTLTAAGYPHRFRQVQFQQASHILNPVPPQKEKLLRLLFAQERQFATGCRAARQAAFRLATA